MRPTLRTFALLCCVVLAASTARAGDSNKKLIAEVSAFGDAVAEAMMGGDHGHGHGHDH